MRKATRTQKYVLGDLIAALFEEAKKVSKNRLEQNLLVYAALRDLLRNRVHSMRPIAVRI
jgi:hypothetical protein